MESKSRLAAVIVVVLVLATAAGSCAGIPGISSEAEPTPLPPGVDYRTREYRSPEVQDDGTRTLYAPEVERNGTPAGDQHLELVGGSQAPPTLDPAVLRDAESAFLARQIFRGLTRLDTDLNPHPDLAERIEVSSDGLVYTFHLRSEAVFHDGTAITAQAVADSLNRAADPRLANGNGFSLAAATYLVDIAGARDRLAGDTDRISGIEVLDEFVLRITLHQSSQTFLSKLAGSPALVVDVTSISGGDWWRDPNGSGPFRIEDFDPEATLRLAGFDQFWDGAPLLDSVRVRYGVEAVQPLNLYEAGDIDVTRVPQYATDRVLSETGYLHDQLVVQPQLSTTFIVFNRNAPPFDDPAVREALVHAVDREKIVNVTFQGQVRLAEGLVPPGILEREWPAELPEFDLDESRLALERTAPPSRPPQIYDPGGIAVILKQVVEDELDLDVEAISQEWPEFSEQLTGYQLPAFVLTWVADYADPENFLEALFHSDSPDNYGRYSNPEVDRLLDQAATASDAEERARLYSEAQQRIIDDGVLIPLYHEVDHTLVKPYVRDLAVTSVGILALDSVWIEN